MEATQNKNFYTLMIIGWFEWEFHLVLYFLFQSLYYKIQMYVQVWSGQEYYDHHAVYCTGCPKKRAYPRQLLKKWFSSVENQHFLNESSGCFFKTNVWFFCTSGNITVFLVFMLLTDIHQTSHIAKWPKAKVPHRYEYRRGTCAG